MEVIIKASRQGCPDSGHLLEVGDARAHDTLKSSEVLEQLATLGGPEAGHHLEHGLVVATGTFAPVAGDGEPVGLIANPLDEAGRR